MLDPIITPVIKAFVFIIEVSVLRSVPLISIPKLICIEITSGSCVCARQVGILMICSRLSTLPLRSLSQGL